MTPAFRAFTAAAHPRGGAWRPAAALASFLILIFAGAAALGFGMKAIDVAPPETALVALASFLFWPPALAIALRVARRRRLASLLGPARDGRARRFAAGFAIALGLSAVSALLAWALSGAPVRAPATLGAWALVAAAALPLLLVQTLSEELLFRGFLLQELGARFRSPLAWAAVPSFVFGLLHWTPDAEAHGVAVMITAGGVGLALALVTARTGDLYAAWGAHFGLNLPAILAIGAPGPLSGLALWRWPGGGPSLTGDIALTAAAGLVAALWFRRVPRGD